MKKLPIVGIQGGIGSFNEQALSMNVQRYKVRYLYNTKTVFSHLKSGRIDLGQFAVANNQSGIVQESFDQISENNFRIVTSYTISVSQNLLVKAGTDMSDINTVMAHPQTFLQCKKTLTKKYSNFNLLVGDGKFIDPAYVARSLMRGQLPESTAVIGSQKLAEVYNLKIVARNLQDDKKNLTTFLLISQKGHDFEIDLV